MRTYLPAFLCAGIVVLGYLIVRPYAEIGINDDWSYVKTAQVFAQTGKIAYNGWGSPMLGWQLLFADSLAKIFGFSFTAVRATTFFVAVVTAFLLQRTCVRAGINEWNATLATIAFVLSYLYLPLAFSFMTDVSGVFCVLLCLYMCLRALEAGSERATAVWISLAALLNAIGGTARQTAWLGVLVMVPSTLWLLRRSRRVLVAGSLSWFASAGIIFAAWRWFDRQPFSNPISPMPNKIDMHAVKLLSAMAMLGAGELSLLLFPVLLMFVGSLRPWSRRRVNALLVCSLALLTIVLFAVKLRSYITPFFGDDLMSQVLQALNGVLDSSGHPRFALRGLHYLLAGVAAISLLSFLSFVFGSVGGSEPAFKRCVPISWKKLGVVLGPFALGYVAWIADIVTKGFFDDRYLLPMFLITLLVLVLYYQQMARVRLPLTCAILIAIFGGFSIACTHDEFATHRAEVAAIDQLRSAGVPASAIWGPMEFNTWNQVDKAGFIHAIWIPLRQGEYVPRPVPDLSSDCNSEVRAFLDYTPDIKPIYTFSSDPRACDGPAGFQPVTYRTWLSPRIWSIYVVKLPASLGR